MRPCALAGNFRFSQPNVPRTIKTLSNIEIKDAAISVPRGPFGQKKWRPAVNRALNSC